MYFPAEDSYLLKKCLEKQLSKLKNKNFKILDMGSGSGIQASSCKKLGFKNIVCADIDSETIKFLRKQKFKAIKSNLFSKLKNKNNKFDLIIFNPPYLPEHKFDKKKDTTGGKKGYETIIRFLKQSKKHLSDEGKIFLLFSSLSKPKIIKQHLKKLDYQFKLLAEKNLFFEKLFVYEVTK